MFLFISYHLHEWKSAGASDPTTKMNCLMIARNTTRTTIGSCDCRTWTRTSTSDFSADHSIWIDYIFSAVIWIVSLEEAREDRSGDTRVGQDFCFFLEQPALLRLCADFTSQSSSE